MDERALIDGVMPGFLGWGTPTPPRERAARRAVFVALLDLGEPELAMASLLWPMDTSGFAAPTRDMRELTRRLMERA